MRNRKVLTSRQGAVSATVFAILILFVMVGQQQVSVAQAEDKGRILAIITEKDVFRRGETVRVNVEVQNLHGNRRHQLVVLNILDATEKAIYDSNLVKQNIEFLIGPGERRTVGPFTFKIPGGVPPGRYNLLVGYREYPWDPLIEFRGAKWCPPVRTIAID